MRLQQEEDFGETAPPRSQVGLVLGLWLSGVFAASSGDGWRLAMRGRHPWCCSAWLWCGRSVLCDGAV